MIVFWEEALLDGLSGVINVFIQRFFGKSDGKVVLKRPFSQDRFEGEVVVDLIDPKDNLLWSEPVTGETMSMWESNDPRIPIWEKGWHGCGCVFWRVLPSG